MKMLVPFEFDEKDRKAVAFFYKEKGLSNEGICTMWLTMAVEAALDDALEKLDEHEHKKKLKKRPKRKSRG